MYIVHDLYYVFYYHINVVVDRFVKSIMSMVMINIIKNLSIF